MALSFIDWERDGILVLNLTGELKLGAATSLFRQLIDDALGLGRKDLILNLGDVVYIDSSGLGELVSAHLRVSRAGGTLKLVKLRAGAKQLMQSTRLFMLFELYDDEDSAVRSYPSSSSHRPEA